MQMQIQVQSSRLKRSALALSVGVTLGLCLSLSFRAQAWPQGGPPMDSERAKAFEACKSELALSGDPRQFDVDTRQQFGDCLRSKNVQLPDRPARSGPMFAKMKECMESKGATLPDFKPGSTPPDLDETTMTALQSCRQELGAFGPPPGGRGGERPDSQAARGGGGVQ